MYGTGKTSSAEDIDTPPAVSEAVKEDVRVSETEKKEEVISKPTATVDDEDDTMSYFSKLVNEDN